MPSDIIKQISEHLEFLGYKVAKDEEQVALETFRVNPSTEDPRKPSFTIRVTQDGVLFIAGFSVSPDVNKNPLPFLQLVNEGNLDAYVARFT